MDIEKRSARGVTVVHVSGKMNAIGAKDFEEAVLAAFAAAPAPILVNFTNLDYISSAGIRVLILAARKDEQRQCGWGLCCLAEPVSEVLTMAGLGAMLPVFADEEQGLEALASRQSG